ncbi:MAG: CarD family transcriptional regulator [Lachnospiraceae bacterium]|nr:CarD family transcriptional regulator [Lachnospiraceae bacterium]
MYEIGDYIVKAVYGVCRVEDILHMNMSGTDKLYYMLIPIEDKGAKIYVPTDTVDIGIRKTMTKEEAWEFIERIPEIEETWIDNEKLREKRYKEVVRSCKPDDLVGIIKTTYLRKKRRLEQGKKNTAVDERYLKMAENHLYSELGFALDKDKDEILGIIEDAIARIYNPFKEN